MKTLRKLILGIVAIAAVVSCDNPIGLGSKLDLEGPVLEFTAPVPRKAVTTAFTLEGTVSDRTGIGRVSVRIEKDRKEMPRQWRYSGGKWEISDNYGSSWSDFPQGKWEGGGNSAVWSIPVEMFFRNPDTGRHEEADDGQYMFIGQAWDSGEMSDDNSFKTLILIIDNNPPKVSISRPLLYSRYLDYDPANDKFDVSGDEGKEIERLRSLTDWRDPEFIGKFQTNTFDMQWGIEDDFNIWSFDLRFYDMSVFIDENKDTPLPDNNYIYRVYQNTPPAPESPSPSDYVRPNGSITIPALEGPAGRYGNGELKNPVSVYNTTIRVVAVCYDAANNPTQEKTIGFFIYWAQADIPWITFSGDLKEPEYYNDYPAAASFRDNVKDSFLIYPGVEIKAVAFHPQGVTNVKYTLWKLTDPITAGAFAQAAKTKEDEKTLVSEISSRGKFEWGFTPEPRSAFYVIEAQVTSISTKTSPPVKAVFQVLDISFPNFPAPVSPPALEPLYRHITDDSITISGVVADATKIDSLCLVWLNPQARDSAAMAQLEYFRDAGYAGWEQALQLAPGTTGVEYANVPLYGDKYPYDSVHPNRLWKLNPTPSTKWPNGLNPDSQRVEYDYSIKIPLALLNLGMTGNQPLKSQVFLLRAANTDRRTTIITYTPQGDESPPVIEITSVVVTHAGGGGSTTLTPGHFTDQIKKFALNDRITVNGIWKEDSVGFLPFDLYLKNNFEVTVNLTKEFPDNKLTNITFPSGASNSNEGTWKAEVTVGNAAGNLPLASMKDTLVVAASVKDIGDNAADDGASWLIESDALRLVRVSSEAADMAYNAGKEIEIFLEFNKPVFESRRRDR